MYSLIYTSVASLDLSGGELQALMRHACIANERLGITGLLLCKEGRFMQVLEGEREKVTQLSERIARDPRHSHFSTLQAGPINEREFPNWSMGFRDLERDPPSALAGYSEFSEIRLTSEEFLADPSRAHRFLSTFQAH